ncbi:MAG: protein jag [Clostridia bacterium]|nr:protein jag [Clostridia bacterium]
MSSFQKRKSFTEKSAKSKEEAITLALEELGAEREEVEIEVVDEGSKGFLGIGARDARVRVTLLNAPEEVEEAEEAEIAPAPKQAAPKKREPKRSKPTRESLGTPDMDAKKFLEDIFAAMNLDVAVSASFDGDTVNINLDGDNMGIVIGKRGDTLDSLQYLTSLVVNQRSEDYIKVSIDTENYREKRTDALLALSNRLAGKVARTGKKFTLEPMNPYERRIIHSNLQDNPDVTTFSVGQEPYRKVVIAPKNAKPYKKDGYKKRNNRSRKPREERPVAQKTGEGYTTTYDKADTSETLTYKADFKPQQHKAEYKNFEEYLEAHSGDDTI